VQPGGHDGQRRLAGADVGARGARGEDRRVVRLLNTKDTKGFSLHEGHEDRGGERKFAALFLYAYRGTWYLVLSSWSVLSPWSLVRDGQGRTKAQVRRPQKSNRGRGCRRGG